MDWYRPVNDRHWFNAPLRAEAEHWLKECERQLEEFEARVFVAQPTNGEAAKGSREKSRRSRRTTKPNRAAASG